MDWKPGDIAACYGRDFDSRVISVGTLSVFGPRRLFLGPSHVAILCEKPRGDGLMWVESTTLCRHSCAIQNRKVSGVQAHEPDQRVNDYLSAGGSVDVYRLSPIRSLSHDESGLLRDILVRHFIEKEIGYDLGGALISGTRVLKLSSFWFADLNEVFCSELIAAVLQALCRLGDENPTRFNPGSLLRKLVRRGTYKFECQARTEGPIRVYRESVYEDDEPERRAA